MRQDYDQFKSRGVEVLALGPDGPKAFQRYWKENDIPFPGMADLHSRVARQYDQEVNLLKLGRMPALFIIDAEGMIRYSHYGDSMSDIPPNSEVLGIIEHLLERE